MFFFVSFIVLSNISILLISGSTFEEHFKFKTKYASIWHNEWYPEQSYHLRHRRQCVLSFQFGTGTNFFLKPDQSVGIKVAYSYYQELSQAEIRRSSRELNTLRTNHETLLNKGDGEIILSRNFWLPKHKDIVQIVVETIMILLKHPQNHIHLTL
jgi:hypothetical protein